MFANVSGPSFMFWPVGCGDTTTIVVSESEVVQIDINDKVMAAEKGNEHIPIVDELVEKLPKRNGKPYLSVFALTHPDLDHCRGFKDLLKRVTIGEIWHTPRIFRENKMDLSPDAQAFRNEARRRAEQMIAVGGDAGPGDRVRLIGYSNLFQPGERYYGFPKEEFYTRPGQSITKIDGVEAGDRFHAFVHAPFKEGDVIVDATASRTVAVALERRFGKLPKSHPPLLTMTFGHDADRALMTLATAASEGMSLDVDRRSKIAFANSNRGKPFLDEFWPVSADRQRLFQPEPGCSDPTFRGSAADVLGLTSRMFNLGAAWLSEAEQSRHRCYAFDLSNRRPKARLPAELEFDWPPDDVLIDLRHGYRLRLSRAARTAILSWVRRSERVRGPRVETGGVLFGEADEFLRLIWIDEASGPPPDSVASEAGFVCGVEGVQDLQAEKMKRTRGSVRFVGMWHTHPGGMPIPSHTDRSAMAQLLRGNDFLGRQFLMLIVGGTAANALISGNVFKRAEYGN